MTLPTAPTSTTPTPTTAPSLPRSAPAKPTLDLGMFQRATDAIQAAQAAPVGLPLDIQPHVNTFWTALQAAQNIYAVMAEGYPKIWETAQYPMEFRRQKAEEFMDAALTQQRTHLDAAARALDAARQIIRDKSTAPQLGDPTTHELKLLNARQDVLASVEGLPQAPALLEELETLFKEAHKDNTDPAMVYLLTFTPFYRRVLKDAFLRMGYTDAQRGMVRLVLPEALPYLDAETELARLAGVLEMAEQVRGFTAMDNGLLLSTALTETAVTVTPQASLAAQGQTAPTAPAQGEA